MTRSERKADQAMIAGAELFARKLWRAYLVRLLRARAFQLAKEKVFTTHAELLKRLS